jgi:hypothetical protein
MSVVAVNIIMWEGKTVRKERGRLGFVLNAKRGFGIFHEKMTCLETGAKKNFEGI